MSNSDGCIWQILGLIGWAIFCIICYNLGTDPLTGMIVCLIVGFVLVLLLCLCIHIYEAFVEKKKKKLLAKCELIRNQYPNAFNEYIRANKLGFNEFDKIKDLKVLLEISSESWSSKESQIKDYLEKQNKARNIEHKYKDGFREWCSINKYDYKHFNTLVFDIVANENLIVNYDRRIKAAKVYDVWEVYQEAFNSKCYELSLKELTTFGRYKYDINIDKQDKQGNIVKGNFYVWQFFPDALCLNEALDYTLRPAEKNNLDNLSQFKQCKRYFNEYIHKNIMGYILDIQKNHNDLCIVFNDEIEDWDKDTLEYHYKNLKNYLIKEGVVFYDLSNLLQTAIMDANTLPKNKCVIIVDFYTENTNLISKCSLIYNLFGEYTVVSYLSYLKCYANEEMVQIIKQEEDKHKKEVEEKNSLKDKVQNWDLIQGSLRHKFLLDYFPVTCESEANETEWENRWIVWNFKNDPEKNIEEEAHQEALDFVIPLIKTELVSTFGESLLKHLTLVCIPASSKEKTEARYKFFSKKLCEETGMQNAYDYIQVIKNSEQKKLGGSGIQTDNLSFDKDYFKDKYIILFDDIVTKGDSMVRFKRKMQSLECNVVCGFSIGKTTHHH